MLNRPQLQITEPMDDAGAPGRMFANPLSGFDILSAARRQIWVLVASVVVAVLLGILYLVQALPNYTSSASILIDAKKVGMTAATPLEGSLTFETGAVDSQLQILTSDKIASAVATRLGLQNNMAFIDPQGSYLTETVKGAIGLVRSAINVVTQAPPTPEVKDLPEPLRLLLAVNVLQDNLRVARVGRTYVFILDYSNPDPVLAQAIVGQYANAYLEDQLDSKFDSTRRATNWMEERIRDLKAQSLAADEAVQKYRADNNLVEASGRLIDEQSLTDATTQLTTPAAPRYGQRPLPETEGNYRQSGYQCEPDGIARESERRATAFALPAGSKARERDLGPLWTQPPCCRQGAQGYGGLYAADLCRAHQSPARLSERRVHRPGTRKQYPEHHQSAAPDQCLERQCDG
ncbi:hypothetical protein AJ87_07075 [Rhizobium yanglingense]|nr:hypothetical protein AJ87_07075 [Rhizobium yanglingense]